MKNVVKSLFPKEDSYKEEQNMRKGIRGKIAGILAAILLGTTIFPGNVFAEETVAENTADGVSDVGENAETNETGLEDVNGELSEQDGVDTEANIENSQPDR